MNESTVIEKSVGNHTQSTIEKVINGKKYIVRAICTGSSGKNARDTLLLLAERRAIQDMRL